MVFFSFALPLLAILGQVNEISFTGLPEDTVFMETEFCGEAFLEIPGWSAAAQELGLQSFDLFRKSWIFADGVLTIESHGTEGFVTSFTPAEPMGEETALIAAAFLARGGIPEFSERDEIAVVYEDSGFAGGSRLVLNLDSGMVTEITFVEWSP